MLASMDHPYSYSNRASCQWNIRVPTGKNVYLHFSSFSLEETTLCLNDKVTLSDNIGTLGSHIPCGISKYTSVLLGGPLQGLGNVDEIYRNILCILPFFSQVPTAAHLLREI